MMGYRSLGFQSRSYYPKAAFRQEWLDFDSIGLMGHVSHIRSGNLGIQDYRAEVSLEWATGQSTALTFRTHPALVPQYLRSRQ